MSDELLLIEIEHLRQMLVIASIDVSKFINCKPSDYLHDFRKVVETYGADWDKGPTLFDEVKNG